MPMVYKPFVIYAYDSPLVKDVVEIIFKVETCHQIDNYTTTRLVKI